MKEKRKQTNIKVNLAVLTIKTNKNNKNTINNVTQKGCFIVSVIPTT